MGKRTLTRRQKREKLKNRDEKTVAVNGRREPKIHDKMTSERSPIGWGGSTFTCLPPSAVIVDLI